MTWSNTLAGLITEVRENGDYENSDVFTDAKITRMINKGIARVHDWIIQEDLSHHVTEGTLTTTSGVSTVALPSTFYKLVRLDKQISTDRYIRCRRFNLAEENRYTNAVTTAYGNGYWYRLQGSNIALRPTPTATDTLRIIYIPHATELVNTSDTYDGINGFEELVVEYALLYCDKREERSLTGRLREIERLKAEIKAAASNRDSAEPQMLSDHGAEGWYA